MIDPDLLAILCCPESHQPLAPAEPALLARLNEQVAAGRLRNRAGQPVTQPLQAGLVRRDGQWLYPVRDALPVLLVDEAIPVAS